MFELLLWAVIIIALIAMVSAFDGSRDVFHPLVFIMPMMIFLYGWMPMKLLGSGSLSQYFDLSQLVYVQSLNAFGVLAFAVGCLAAGSRISKSRIVPVQQLSSLGCTRLRLGASLIGGVGLLCWLISIVNVGGFVNAFSKSYGGGWDDSGYVRDGTLLLLVGVLLMIGVIASEGLKLINLMLICTFGLPWLTQALLMARRGPTFAIMIILCMGSYLMRNKRPPVPAVILGGLFLGWLSLFLVTNRSNIYLGSDSSLTDVTDVTNIVEKSDTGNEYIYGTGAVVSTDRQGNYFWMRRYLAQLLVRPIPSAIWPTKYQDFGVPELLSNAGTGEGFGESLGWVGAVGSAPGIIADLFIEVWWFAVPFMAVLGWAYGYLWNRAMRGGAEWKCQYVILAALSMYLVMQTMEAVIFRTLLLSIPSWLAWRWALRASPARQSSGPDFAGSPVLEEGRLLGA